MALAPLFIHLLCKTLHDSDRHTPEAKLLLFYFTCLLLSVETSIFPKAFSLNQTWLALKTTLLLPSLGPNIAFLTNSAFSNCSFQRIY